MRPEDRNILGTKRARIILLCILNAWLFVLISEPVACGVMVVQRMQFSIVIQHYLTSLTISAATTIISSRILSLMIWPFLKQKDLSRCSTPFYVTTVASALILGVMLIPETVVLYAILLILSAVLWWLLPVVYESPGVCRRCGYDLTGNVSGQCPECGQAIAMTNTI